jgi:hypothetical protein
MTLLPLSFRFFTAHARHHLARCHSARGSALGHRPLSSLQERSVPTLASEESGRDATVASPTVPPSEHGKSEGVRAPAFLRTLSLSPLDPSMSLPCDGWQRRSGEKRDGSRRRRPTLRSSPHRVAAPHLACRGNPPPPLSRPSSRPCRSPTMTAVEVMLAAVPMPQPVPMLHRGR